MNLFPTCRHGYRVCASCLGRPEENIRFPRTRVNGGCEPPHGFWEQSPGLPKFWATSPAPNFRKSCFYLFVCVQGLEVGEAVLYHCVGIREQLTAVGCPSGTWVLGIKLRSRTLAASAFLHRAIFPVPLGWFWNPIYRAGETGSVDLFTAGELLGYSVGGDCWVLC